MEPPQRLLDETRDSSVDSSAVDPIVSSIISAPVTVERKPYIQPDHDLVLPHAGSSLQDFSIRPRLPILLAGTPRANIAATHESPNGTTAEGWAERHSNQTVS
jgi:peroxygenase